VSTVCQHHVDAATLRAYRFSLTTLVVVRVVRPSMPRIRTLVVNNDRNNVRTLLASAISKRWEAWLTVVIVQARTDLWAGPRSFLWGQTSHWSRTITHHILEEARKLEQDSRRRTNDPDPQLCTSLAHRLRL
jgi:hypothetical protein